jgi:hypothetical protein
VPDAAIEFEVFVGDNLIETVKMPTAFRDRRHDVTWKYDLPEGNHTVRLKAKKILPGYRVETNDVLVYSSKEPGTRVYF